MEKLRKRKWTYVQYPSVYEVFCDKCGGTNTTWSEYEHLIWCYDCEVDTEGTLGIFGGPIPIRLTELFGVSFYRVYLKTNRIMKPVTSKDGKQIVYRMCSREELSRFKRV